MAERKSTADKVEVDVKIELDEEMEADMDAANISLIRRQAILECGYAVADDGREVTETQLM